MNSVASTLNKRNTLVWAVNPADNPQDAKALVSEIKIWSKKLNCDVQPIVVFSKLYLNFPAELNILWDESFESLAEVSAKQYLKKLPTKSFLPPKILFVASLSNRRLAYELLEYTEKINPLLIFANTRVKKNWNPLRLGGFSETLITTSKTPVLLMNPKAEPHTQKKSILFPTDFSHESNVALAHIEPWVTALSSEILLFNQVETPNPYSAEFSDSDNMKKLMKEAQEARTQKLNAWAQHLAKQHVKSKVVIHQQNDYIANDIIKTAKKNKAGLIVLANRNGPYTQALLGSVARDVLVQAQCPVLIFHRNYKKKLSKQSSAFKSSTSKAAAAASQTHP